MKARRCPGCVGGLGEFAAKASQPQPAQAPATHHANQSNRAMPFLSCHQATEAPAEYRTQADSFYATVSSPKIDTHKLSMLVLCQNHIGDWFFAPWLLPCGTKQEAENQTWWLVKRSFRYFPLNGTSYPWSFGPGILIKLARERIRFDPLPTSNPQHKC